VLRTSPEGDQHILTMTNVTNRSCDIVVPVSGLGIEACRWYDLIGQRGLEASAGELRLSLQPYDVVWLKPAGESSDRQL